MTVFKSAKEAAQAIVEQADALGTDRQYEIGALFDNDRAIIGFQVRVKDSDGFGSGSL